MLKACRTLAPSCFAVTTACAPCHGGPDDRRGAVIKAHGDPMPVFGKRFRSDAEDRYGVLGGEVFARGRGRVLYLPSIQE